MAILKFNQEQILSPDFVLYVEEFSDAQVTKQFIEKRDLNCRLSSVIAWQNVLKSQ